jgi:hypothetical protein
MLIFPKRNKTIPDWQYSTEIAKIYILPIILAFKKQHQRDQAQAGVSDVHLT